MSCTRYRIIGVIILTLLVGATMYSQAQGAAANFYVATNGNNAWSGTLPAPNAAETDGPFATLARARDAIRELKADKGLREPLKVLVRGGTYYLPETFTLGPEDSGTANFPITYMAYAGEKVMVSGGRLITGWKPYRGKIWQCDLNALGLGELSFKQLFYNGERQPLARFPNVDPDRPRTGGFLYVFEGGVKDSKNLLKYDPTKLDPSRWAKPTLVEVKFFAPHNWINFIRPIAEIDPVNHIITLGGRPSTNLTGDTRFYFRNAFEELDAPGEWYRDSESGTLYFWPPDDALAHGKVVVPALDSIIHIKGESANNPVGCLRIGGFGIQACQGHAVDMQAAQHCTIAKCTISNTGGHGVYLGSTCSDNRVVGNDIAHIGITGVRVAGRDNLVSNNHLHDVEVITITWYGAIGNSGRGNVISHNLIHDVPRLGIDLGLGLGDDDNIVEYNDVHHTMLETSDGEGIGLNIWPLSARGKAGVGNIIRFNRVTDSIGYGMRSPGQWASPWITFGIRMDDYTSDIIVYGNIVARNAFGICIHGGRDNVIENNIIVESSREQFRCPNIKQYMSGNRFIRNIVYYANPDAFLIATLGWTEEMFAESDYNVFFHFGQDLHRRRWSSISRPDAASSESYARWRQLGYDAHSIIGDPMFVDVPNDDFRLRPESPAFKLGFQPIPVERIGLYPSPNRASWPVPDYRDLWREEPVLNP